MTCCQVPVVALAITLVIVPACTMMSFATLAPNGSPPFAAVTMSGAVVSAVLFNVTVVPAATPDSVAEAPENVFADPVVGTELYCMVSTATPAAVMQMD